MAYWLHGTTLVILTVLTLSVSAVEKNTATGIESRQIKPSIKQQSIKKPVSNKVLVNRIANLRKTRDLLRRQAAAPLPKNLTPEERAEAVRYNKWLKSSAVRLDELANRGQAIVTHGDKNPGPNSGMEQMNQSFSMQYLQIQQEMQQQAREFNLISQIMKTKHEAAKNAINNIR